MSKGTATRRQKDVARLIRERRTVLGSKLKVLNRKVNSQKTRKSK